MIPSPFPPRIRRIATRALAALAVAFAVPLAAHAIVVTISPAPVGGRVVSNIGGIDCPGTCTSADLGSFASIQLTAIADPGYTFVEWQESGFAVSTSVTYFLFTASNSTLSAIFGGAPSFPGPNAGTLTVLTAGSVAVPVAGQPAPTVALLSGSLPDRKSVV